MTFGHNLSSFWVDKPDAVAQAVVTRLRLQQGEYFLDTREGVPWKTEILGVRTENSRDYVIRSRIVGTRGLKELINFNSQLNRQTREYSFQAEIDTIYGRTSVKGGI